MSKYCCFFCPAKDYNEKSLEDTCPTCGRPYGFVLSNKPAHIRDFRITRDLGRGFYGSAYVAERGAFGKKFVLKISPVEFYSFFAKPAFIEETEMHAKLAENAVHVVGIDDAFEEEVEFSDIEKTKLKCYVTVLDYVDGELLRNYVDGEVVTNSASICQIAIDLLRIRSEFGNNQLNHNDLHAENLIVEKLKPQARRSDAIDDTIRVKAIDLGSISDESKSSNNRDGDLLFIAKHVDRLLDRLLATPIALQDRDYRTALALQSTVQSLLGDVENIRHPDPNDLIEQIREGYYRAAHHWQPWINPLQLKGFGDHYNAQTLESWNVPRLLVDPENRWLAEVTIQGPQIITGMRGCGKTMLLRSIDFHARAAKRDDETSKSVIDRIAQDRFVGLFASAQRLLDLREQPLHVLEHRLTRLFVYYSLQAARALLHLKDIDQSALSPGAHSKLANAVSDFLEGAEDLKQSVSLEDLERKLEKITILTLRSEEGYLVRHAPAQVFSHLAEHFCACSYVFQASSVFFLLDDVSTRYLEIEKIGGLLSSLLFQHPRCAFKFTSEWQTIELGLQSPGRIHPIRVGRDLSLFDLGADVHDKIKESGKSGVNFVEQILMQRASVHHMHPNSFTPRQLLGDVALEKVAREIAAANKTSAKRKHAYRGISCLANVCVGDIGDVIKLYGEILKRSYPQTEFPIPQKTQSECFQWLSALRIFDLNRNESYFKDHALGFAQASYKLLIRSLKELEKSKSGRNRLRQYSSIYVRITTDDEKSTKKQIDRLRDLIDAGVFVYSGGAPRTKTKDSNPFKQFKLSYRKIYGLAASIGLADSDRFELSGDDLAEWLENPAQAEAILIRNQIKDEDEVNNLNEIYEDDLSLNERASLQEDNALTKNHDQFSIQQNLFQEEQRPPILENGTKTKISAKQIDIEVEQITKSSLATIELGGILTGLGFEDRTLASNRFLSEVVRAPIIHAVRYSLEGHASAILNHWAKVTNNIMQIDYSDALFDIPAIDGLTLIDISGLSKPLIFKAVRRELIEKGRVLLCHAQAEHHYPLHDDLEKLFATKKAKEPLVFLENLANVLKGETGPYSAVKLLDEEADPSRSRALLAFASAKHERLFSLLDKREFDFIEVIAPTGDVPRSKVAFYSAEFLCQNYQNAKITRIDTSDLFGLLKYLDEQFLDIYGDAGANLEIGLTGSKTQAVAAAILSARRKVAQAWYLSPKQFDENRFSSGVGEIKIYDIRSSSS